jgi:molecular chaperone GrpE
MDEPKNEAAENQATDPAIDALRREAEESRDRCLRLAAELDNFRKRSARELEAARKYGAERLAQALLPVCDSLEAGLAAAEKAGEGPIVEGQRATLRLLEEAFASVGVRPIDPQGQPFDPNKHDALSVMHGADAPPNTVVEVVQKGYELHDRLLRAAKVIVSPSPEA